MTMQLTGAFTALITPFRNQEIDESALRSLVDFQISNGIHGLVPCGTTGESATMTEDERRRVIEIVIDQTAGRVPVIAGTGIERHPPHHRSDATRASGRRKCRARRRSLLQQANPGRANRPLHRDRELFGVAARALQRSGTHRDQHVG